MTVRMILLIGALVAYHREAPGQRWRSAGSAWCYI